VTGTEAVQSCESIDETGLPQLGLRLRIDAVVMFARRASRAARKEPASEIISAPCLRGFPQGQVYRPGGWLPVAISTPLTRRQIQTVTYLA
jgi:hypothetical protein